MASKLEGTPIEAAASRAAAPDRARRAVLRLIAASRSRCKRGAAVAPGDQWTADVVKAARAPVSPLAAFSTRDSGAVNSILRRQGCRGRLSCHQRHSQAALE